MKRFILEQIKKDKYYNYLKENSFFIKDLNRNPRMYDSFKEYVKDKYHLRISDKVENMLDDIETISDIVNVIK